jgi:uncharacterized protein (TIRG00374 family)
MKNRLFTLLRVLISFSLIGLLLWFMRDSIPDIGKTIKTADKQLLLWGFLIYLFAAVVISFRLQKVIAVQSIRLTAKEATYLTFIGYFFNNFLPTSFGGDLVKAYYAGKKSHKKAGAYAGVFMDRVFATIPFTMIPAFTLIFFHKVYNSILVIASCLLFGSCLIAIWLLLHRKTAKFLVFFLEPFKEKLWYGRMKDGYNFLNLYSRHKIIFLWSLALSLAAQVISIISTYLFARAIGIDYVGLGIFFVVVPLVWVLTLIPSLNGLGVREGGFVYLFRGYMPKDKAFAISILVLATCIAFSIIGGIIYSFQKNTFAVKEEIR